MDDEWEFFDADAERIEESWWIALEAQDAQHEAEQGMYE